MKTAMITSLLTVATAGGNLALTWKDCGAKHAKTTDVQPTTLALGQETEITGAGTVDEDVSGGTFDAEVKAGGGLIDQHFTGNVCEAKDFNLPLGIGKLSWEGVSCPLKAGDASIKMKVTLASALPAAVATSDITLKAKDQNADDLLCVSLHLAKAAEILDAEVGDHGQIFLEGFISGFIGEAKHIKACVAQSEQMIKDSAALVADLKARNFNSTVQDIQALVMDVGAELPSCKGAGEDLKPILEAFKGVHSIKDLMEKLKNNFLAHDRDILNILEDEIEVCTFGSPDAHKCGADLGKQVRSLVIGDQSDLKVTALPGKIFMEGFIEGFLGKAKHIQACVEQSVKTEEALAKLVSDMKAHKFNQTITDIQELIADGAEDLSTCKDAGKDLAPIMAAFKDIHSIKDLMQKLKENFLAHDKEFIDILEDMIEVCTFGAPDAHKCGEDVGRQARSLVIGDQAVLV